MSQDISTERLDELIGSQQRQIAGADFNGMPFMATENREILPALLELKRRREEGKKCSALLQEIAAYQGSGYPDEYDGIWVDEARRVLKSIAPKES